MKKAWYHFKYIYDHNRVFVVVNLLAAVITATLDVLAIYVTGTFIDSMVSLLGKYQTLTFAELLTTESFSYLVMLTIIWLAQRALKAIETATKEVIFHKLHIEYRQSVISKMIKFNLEDILDPTVYDLMQNVNDFWLEHTHHFYNSIKEIGSGTIKLVLAFGVFIDINPWWGILLMIIVLPEQYMHYIWNRKVKKVYDNVVEERRYQDYIYNISTLVRNFPELRVNNILVFLKRRYKKHGKHILHQIDNVYILRHVWLALANQFGKILQLLIRMNLIIYAISVRLSIGTFKYLYDYIGTLYKSAGHVFSELIVMDTALHYLQDFEKFMNYYSFGEIPFGGQQKLPKKITSLQISNVNFIYPYLNSHKSVLKKFNLDIKRGQKIAFIGGDGSGKTTVINLIAGLFRIQEGDIKINNISVRDLSRQELKGRLSIMFEDFGRYYFTIKENIIIADLEKPFNEKLYQQALQITGLDKWMKEEKLNDTQVLGNYFKNGIEISSGHWQRIAIARMIYRNREIFIMDEPFTYIDVADVAPIFKRLLKFIDDRILLMNVQSPSLLPYFNSVYEIKHGRIKEKQRNGYFLDE